MLLTRPCPPDWNGDCLPEAPIPPGLPGCDAESLLGLPTGLGAPGPVSAQLKMSPSCKSLTKTNIRLTEKTKNVS